MKTFDAKLTETIRMCERIYKMRADSDVGYLINDGDAIEAIMTSVGIGFGEAEALFETVYPNIKSNRGKYMTVEDEVKNKLGIRAVHSSLNGVIPTRKELDSAAMKYAEENGIRNKEMFVIYCECNITMRMEMGTRIGHLDIKAS